MLIRIVIDVFRRSTFWLKSFDTFQVSSLCLWMFNHCRHNFWCWRHYWFWQFFQYSLHIDEFFFFSIVIFCLRNLNRKDNEISFLFVTSLFMIFSRMFTILVALFLILIVAFSTFFASFRKSFVISSLSYSYFSFEWCFFSIEYDDLLYAFLIMSFIFCVDASVVFVTFSFKTCCNFSTFLIRKYSSFVMIFVIFELFESIFCVFYSSSLLLNVTLICR